eukprot:Rmarinus@m.22936
MVLQNPIKCATFNQDQNMFIFGSSTGFCVYTVDELKRIVRRRLPSLDNHGGIKLIDALYTSNVVGFVNSWTSNKVIFWDEDKESIIGELTFRWDVLSLHLRYDIVVVVTEGKVFVYKFADLSLMFEHPTASNKLGVCALSTSQNKRVLACPGLELGQVRVQLFSSNKVTFIPAHLSSIAHLTLNADGSCLATCSEKGTIIRVFDTISGELLHELRRGTDPAMMYSMAFGPRSDRLCCSSDKGTVHVFLLPRMTSISSSNHSEGNAIVQRQNSPEGLSFLSGLLPRATHEIRSIARFTLSSECPSVCTFGPERNTVLILTYAGEVFKVSFSDSRGRIGEVQECVHELYKRVHEVGESEQLFSA